MTVAVVIIAAGRPNHLVHTLAALRGQTTAPDDAIVVDMRPERSIAHVVQPPVRWIGLETSGEHLPLAAARNAGAAATDADRLVFLDVDCIAAPDLVERYTEVVEGYPGVLACGPVRYLRPEWAEGRDVSTAGAGLDLDSMSDPHPARTPPRGRHIRIGNDHELFWSLSFGCSRATWTTIGGFDEGYQGYGGEDTDFAFRAREVGVPLAWFAGGTAYHQWHAPTRHDVGRLPEIVANAQRFYARWGTWPMTGWLEDLHQRGCVVFDPLRGRLELVPGS